MPTDAALRDSDARFAPRSPGSTGVATYSQAAIDALPRVFVIANDNHIVGVGPQLSGWIDSHLDDPILERARSGLLATDDPWRRRRLVSRRCDVVFVEIDPVEPALPDHGMTTEPQTTQSASRHAMGMPTPRAVVRVGHWRKAFTDLKTFFKEHGLTSPEIAVEVVNLKRKTVSVLSGTDFLFGVPYAGEPALEEVLARWARRGEPLVADWTPATTRSWYPPWPQLTGPGIPWCALEAAWRLWPPQHCPNCDTQLIVTAFGGQAIGFYRFKGICQAVCPSCMRLQEMPLGKTRHGDVDEMLRTITRVP